MTTLAGLFFATCLIGYVQPAEAANMAEWTILIYMNGDNNLEPEALKNFEQLAKIGGTDEVNVIVQFDRIGKYAHTNPDWSQTLRFQVKKGTRHTPQDALQDLGEQNMGDGAVLADFVRWGKVTFPAKKFMLVIWDHGQGWRTFAANLAQRKRSIEASRAVPLKPNAITLRASSVLLRNAEGVATQDGKKAPFRSAPGSSYRSASNDETDNDVLYNREIQDGLKNVLGNERLDIIAFDACLMAMVESGYAFRDIANYFVASEELEPGLGWRYDVWLNGLVNNPKQDAQSLATWTVSAYANAYRADDDIGPSITLSAVDLSKSKELRMALSTLSDALVSRFDKDLQNIIEARAAVSTYAPGYQFYHVDLIQFLIELKKRINDEKTNSYIDNVLKITNSSIISNYAGSDRMGTYGSKGVAIYFPQNEHDYVTDPYSEGGYEKENIYYPVQFVQDSTWPDFLHAFWKRVP
ncbi:clostripain-related cysteine peptidase [Massilia sp.]|uniref:clostripain-related cysteine peptidase n=1 Tax=Massilia sp. TaxID=1882437 RepID=UPI00352E90B8